MVRIEATDATGRREVSGCGMYLPPARLHDVWMLVQVGGLKVKPGELREGARLEFFAAEGRLLGGTGCNTLRGTFEVHDRTLRFGPLAQTKVLCHEHAAEVERAMLKTLALGWMPYAIRGNELVLSHPDGTELVFRRVE
jgi:heat shock protein HslJ